MKDRVHVTVTRITPTLAAAWLAERPYLGQRHVRVRWVKELAQHMEAGDFLERDPIVFSRCQGTMRLTNGQHRLRAMVLAQKTYTLPVIVTDDATDAEVEQQYLTIDAGLPRGWAEVYRAVGEELGNGARNNRTLGAYVGGCKLLTAGFVSGAALGRNFVGQMALVRSWLKEIKTLMSVVQGPAAKYMLRAPVMGVALLSVRLYGDSALPFWEAMAMDDGLAATDPRKVCLRLLIESVGNTRGQFSAGLARQVAACWNAWVTGRALGKRPGIKNYTRPVRLLAPGTVEWEGETDGE